MNKLVPITLLMAASPLHGAESPPDPLRAAMAGITGDAIAAHVSELASDRYAGRLPGTEGGALTVDYLESELREQGIQPFGDGGYRRTVELRSITTEGSPTLSVGTAQDAIELAYGVDMLASAQRLERRTRIRDAGVVFAGFGITAPEYGWDDYGELDVSGRWVMVLRGDPGSVSGDARLFRGHALTHYGMADYKYEEAARRGAAGVIVVHQQASFGYPWETVLSGANKEKMHLPPEDGAMPARAHAVISEPAARRLLGAAGRDADRMFAAAARPGHRASELDITASIDLRSELGEVRSSNVIGWLPGAERPDEYVIYTAHWDHVGVGPEVDGDSIYNGAVDNATGTAGVLELARSFAALAEPPARSIVFFFTTAEEQGLLGAEAYVRDPVFPLDRTVGVINLDALFPFGRTGGMTVTGHGSSELETYLEAAAAAVGRTLVPNPNPEVGAYYRSDHYPFVKRGVPSVFAVGGPLVAQYDDPAVLGPFISYMQCYHKPCDGYDDAAWDMAGIEQDVRSFFHMGYRLAQDRTWPNWHLDNSFRPLRDAMLTR